MTNRYVCIKNKCAPCESRGSYKGGIIKSLKINSVYPIINQSTHIESMAVYLSYSKLYHSVSLTNEAPYYVVILGQGNFLIISKEQMSEMFEEITILRNRKIAEILE